MPQNKKVCVTGASGYIGSWVTAVLLRKGYTVHATIRTENSPSSAHLTSKNLDPESNGELKIFSGCDLLVDGSFDEAIKGCEVVMHTASPFGISGAKDPFEAFIKPATQGTRNVLESCLKFPSVKQVIVTSSVAAIQGGKIDTKHVYSEADWNTDSTPGYAWSKAVAERTAWEMAGTTTQFTLATVNPGLVLGPSLSTRSNDGTFAFVNNLIDGTWKTCFNISLRAVDVREVADAHVNAMELNATGRFMVVENGYFVPELGKLLSDSKHKNFLTLPSLILPVWVVKTFGGIFGINHSMRANAGKKMKVSRKRAEEILNLTFRPMKETLSEMIDDMFAKNMLPGQQQQQQQSGAEEVALS